MSNANQPQKPRKIGEFLIAEGVIDEGQLLAALAEQRQWGSRLGMTLVRLGFISEDQLIRTLGRQMGLATVRLEGKRIADELLAQVPLNIAEKHRCLPLFLKDLGGVQRLQMAVEDPADLAGLDELSFLLGNEIQPVLVAPSDLEDALRRHYREYSLVGMVNGSPELGAAPEAASEKPAEGVSATPSQTPVVEPAVMLRALVQLIVEKGIVEREELVERLERLSSGESETAD
ncbi:hypothetical protein MK489_04465 [Myxococcota bacterium]|nr:hypothetical protein [Myxococcota bacterium]